MLSDSTAVLHDRCLRSEDSTAASKLRLTPQALLASRRRYLIFHLARFTKNNFYVEKNPTIVNFPVKNLELKDCESRFVRAFFE